MRQHCAAHLRWTNAPESKFAARAHHASLALLARLLPARKVSTSGGVNEEGSSVRTANGAQMARGAACRRGRRFAAL
jgi:hypothetical protein